MNKSLTYHYAETLAKTLDARLHYLLNIRRVVPYHVPGLEVEHELAAQVFSARYPDGVREVLFSEANTGVVFLT